MSSHFSQSGRPRLPDVSNEPPRKWQAKAVAIVSMQPSSIDRLLSGAAAGDILSAAALGGISGAKQACQSMPFCQAATITAVDCQFEADLTLAAIHVEVTVRAVAARPVDTEALSGACAAALTIYELMKESDSSLRIEQVYVAAQDGGASMATPVDMPAQRLDALRPRLKVIAGGEGIPAGAGLTRAAAKAKPKRKPKAKAKAKPKAKPKAKAKPKIKYKSKLLAKPKAKAKTKSKSKGRPKRI